MDMTAPNPPQSAGAGISLAGQVAASPSTGAVSDPSVVTFKPRGSYLDACRAQGVHQAREEMLAEHATLTAQLAVVEGKKGADVTLLADAGETAATHALVVQRAEIVARMEGFFDAYLAVGFGDAHFPLLRRLISIPSADPEIAAELFAIQAGNSVSALSATADAPMSDYERGRTTSSAPPPGRSIVRDPYPPE